MTLAEVAHITGTDIREGNTFDADFLAAFNGLEIKEAGILRGTVGFGATPEAARLALASNVSDKIVITGGNAGPRNSFNLPLVTVD